MAGRQQISRIKRYLLKCLTARDGSVHSFRGKEPQGVEDRVGMTEEGGND